MKGWLFIGLLLLTALPGRSQIRYTTFEKLDSTVKHLPRKTFIYIHTGWCGYCNMMEHTTLQNKAVVQMLNNCFYAISLDAEQQQAITFLGKTYTFVPQGPNSGMHELAAALMKDVPQAAYPLLVLLDEHYRIIYRYNGYMNSATLLRLLQKACAGSKDITQSRNPILMPK